MCTEYTQRIFGVWALSLTDWFVDREESDNEEELREEGLERANTCPEDVAGKVHFIMPKRQLVGGEPEDSDDDDEEEQKKAHPRFNKGSGRRPGENTRALHHSLTSRGDL